MGMRHWLYGSLLLGYSALLGITAWSDGRATAYNDPDGGGGYDGYNPRFTPGQYTPPASLPPLFPTNAQIALAEQAATDGKLPAARQHAYHALRSNPASGRAVAMLFDLYARPDIYILPELPADTEEDAPQAGTEVVEETAPPPEPASASSGFQALAPADKTIADKLALLNLQLNPTDHATLNSLAQYWLAQGEQAKAIQTWADLLVNDRSAAIEAFPVFQAAMGTPELVPIFQQYMASPPPWWGIFFQYLLEHEPDNDKIQGYYLARLQSRQPPDTAERDSYVNHLINQKRWPEAYRIWLGNDAPQIGGSGAAPLLYDGGFEDDNPQHTLFAWNISSTPEARIKLESGTGVTGKRALHISFRKNKSILFQQVAQTQVLAAGHYTLQGRYRLVQLKTDSGLRWRVHCVDDKASLLGESEAFKGRSGWQTFHMTFAVPSDCPAQRVRLESDSQYAHRNLFEGEVWFDDLAIQPQNQAETVP